MLIRIADSAKCLRYDIKRPQRRADCSSIPSLITPCTVIWRAATPHFSISEHKWRPRRRSTHNVGGGGRGGGQGSCLRGKRPTLSHYAFMIWSSGSIRPAYCMSLTLLRKFLHSAARSIAHYAGFAPARLWAGRCWLNSPCVARGPILTVHLHQATGGNGPLLDSASSLSLAPPRFSARWLFGGGALRANLQGYYLWSIRELSSPARGGTRQSDVEKALWA